MTDDRAAIARALSALAKDMRKEVSGERGPYATGCRRGADEVQRAARLIRLGRESEVVERTDNDG